MNNIEFVLTKEFIKTKEVTIGVGAVVARGENRNNFTLIDVDKVIQSKNLHCIAGAENSFTLVLKDIHRLKGKDQEVGTLVFSGEFINKEFGFLEFNKALQNGILGVYNYNKAAIEGGESAKTEEKPAVEEKPKRKPRRKKEK